MSTSYFIRKAMDLDDVKDIYFKNKGKTRGQKFIIEKVIELSHEDFAQFANNLLDDYGFIKENIDLMYEDKENVRHCLLVKTQKLEDAILVESEGMEYARYVAYCPE